jgi:exodeoxyribonuclease VII small subunit
MVCLSIDTRKTNSQNESKNESGLNSAEEKISFEEGIAKLRTLVSEMESGNLGLEEMIASYGEGVKLIKYCEKDSARLKAKSANWWKKADKFLLKPGRVNEQLSGHGQFPRARKKAQTRSVG